MQRDETYLTAGGIRRHRLTRWFAIGLGGALVLALLLGQAARADDHTANLSNLTLTDSAEGGLDATLVQPDWTIHRL